MQILEFSQKKLGKEELRVELVKSSEKQGEKNLLRKFWIFRRKNPNNPFCITNFRRIRHCWNFVADLDSTSQAAAAASLLFGLALANL